MAVFNINDEFDFAKELKEIRGFSSPEKIFNAFDRASFYYDRGKISKHQYLDIKETVFDTFRDLDKIKRACNNL